MDLALATLEAMRAAESPRRELRRDPFGEPSHRRLPPDAPHRAEILAAHAQAQEAGRDWYLDPASGYAVMTASALLDRGSCCGLGCRHCPFLH